MERSAKVGIREFREKLSTYLESESPVAITRHGRTIGFYVPARPTAREEDLEALRAAGARIDALIEAVGSSEEELLADFKRIRRSRAVP